MTKKLAAQATYKAVIKGLSAPEQAFVRARFPDYQKIAASYEKIAPPGTKEFKQEVKQLRDLIQSEYRAPLSMLGLTEKTATPAFMLAYRKVANTDPKAGDFMIKHKEGYLPGARKIDAAVADKPAAYAKNVDALAKLALTDAKAGFAPEASERRKAILKMLKATE